MLDHSVLIADSDHEHSRHLGELFQYLGYRVICTADGVDALRILGEADSPRIAILDVNLPSMSGIEVISELRRRYRKRELWLMLMSAEPSTEEIAMGTDAGMDEFIVKPVTEPQLRMRLRTGERVLQTYEEIVHPTQSADFHSRHDSLTGLHTRDHLLERMFQETDRAIRMGTPLGIILLDIDGFAEFNLKFGFLLGDRALQSIAHRMRRQMRTYDLISRWEDQFCILLPGCNLALAGLLAERMRNHIESAGVRLDGARYAITASFGAAESFGRSPVLLMREVEKALSLAKSVGRNCTRYASGESPAVTPIPQLSELNAAS